MAEGDFLRYEVRVPTNDGWMRVAESKDQEWAEREACLWATNNGGGYSEVGARVDRMVAGPSGRGWQSEFRSLVRVFDEQGVPYNEPLATWPAYHRDLEARGWISE